MQAGDDQQAIQHTVDQQTEAAGLRDAMAQRIDARGERRPRETERRRHEQSREARRDRYESTPSEEGEILRQLDVGITVVERAGDHAGKDAERHAELGDFLRRAAQDHARAFAGDEETDDAGETRGAVVLAREPDGHADREQQAEVREDRIARGGHEGEIEQVRLTEA